MTKHAVTAAVVGFFGAAAVFAASKPVSVELRRREWAERWNRHGDREQEPVWRND